ncbi:MAG: hypothetical protein IJ113_01165 [Eggerthellaceae bacterium]|nr:hypothetical protein [Eggerthellaceae bacterium]
MLSRQSSYTTLGTEELAGALAVLTRRREDAEGESDHYMSCYWQGAHDALWAVGAHRLDTQEDLMRVMDALIERQNGRKETEMPKLGDSYTNATESKGGERKRLEPGVYMSRVQAVRTSGTDARGNAWDSDGKQYVKLILDIDDGEFAGNFSDEYWQGEERDWGHTLYMSFKESAYGMLKHTFNAFNEANGGFDAQAAFEADKWDMFIGKKLLVHWAGEEYEANNGETRVRVRPDRALTSDDNQRAKVKLLDGKRVDYAEYSQPEQSAPSAPYSDENVPF